MRTAISSRDMHHNMLRVFVYFLINILRSKLNIFLLTLLNIYLRLWSLKLSKNFYLLRKIRSQFYFLFSIQQKSGELLYSELLAKRAVVEDVCKCDGVSEIGSEGFEEGRDFRFVGEI